MVREGGCEQRKGSACLMELHCSTCGKLAAEYSSQKTGVHRTGFDINRRIVAAASSIGIGFSQLQRLFTMLGLSQPMSESTWYEYRSTVNTAFRLAADAHLPEAAAQVRATYADMNLGTPDEDGVLNISISIDGTWQKRGRTSHNGVVTVIELFTGLILDFVALSNYCKVCEAGPNPDSREYRDWKRKHEPNCQKNIDCSSGAMEAKGAVILFARSVALHSFRYTSMLGDGDAKTYATLLEEDPYDGVHIEKLECVNHVTKRMGTALRNLVEKKKAQGESISGRGKLTEARIKELTSYYGRAIKDNAHDLEAMQSAVWASFFHTVSNDEQYNHDYCPKGKTSWCFFQRARADNVSPRPHRRPLPNNIAAALKPVYQRLGDPQLLQRCLAGKTQNSNESFHAVLWSACPKERWGSLRTVQTALALSVQRFNKGSSAFVDVLQQLELVVSPSMLAYVEQQDGKRVCAATRKTSSKEKERKKRVDMARRQELHERQEREGNMYGAGQF